MEVKATTAALFSAIEVTGNEWKAAKLHGDNYVLALVTRAMSDRPRIGLLWNPSQHVGGILSVTPINFRLTWNHDT